MAAAFVTNAGIISALRRKVLIIHLKIVLNHQINRIIIEITK